MGNRIRRQDQTVGRDNYRSYTEPTDRWESEDGDYVAGVVTFEPIGTGRTIVNLKLFYDNKGAPAAEEDSLSSIGNHVEEDLQRFQKFMKERQDVDRLGRIPR